MTIDKLEGSELRLAGEVISALNIGLRFGWVVDLHTTDGGEESLIFDALIYDEDTDGYAWTGWDYDPEGTEERAGSPSNGRRLYVENVRVLQAHIN